MKAKEKKVVGSVDEEHNGSKMERYVGVVTEKKHRTSKLFCVFFIKILFTYF